MKVRDEIVSFGAPGELSVDDGGVVGGGTKLTPDALHDLVAERGDDVAFFDGRNALEAAIGRFRGAIVPDVETTRDFVAELDSGKYDDLKGRPVVTYCTGGIRCEVLSSLMVSRGFGEVYQLDGGIVRYGERFGDDGLWQGSLYVFDKRGAIDFSDHADGHRRVRRLRHARRTERRTARMPRATTERVVCESCELPPCAAHCVVAQAHAGLPRASGRGRRAYARAARLDRASSTRMSSESVTSVVRSVISWPARKSTHETMMLSVARIISVSLAALLPR